MTATTVRRVDAASKGRFAINIGSNLLFFLLSLAIGVWYTPFLIRHLGVAVYGLIPLASSVTTYLNVATVALGGSVGRYVTADLARGDIEGARKTFNTFFFAGLLLIGTLGLLAAGFVLLVPRVFNIPAGHEQPAQWLFLALLGMALLSALSTCFDVAIWATSRFEVRTLIDTVALVVRVLTVVVLFHWLEPRLSHVAIAIVLAGLVSFAGFVQAWKHLTPELRIRRADFDRSRIPPLLETSRWLVVNSAGDILLASVDLVLLNLLLGPAVGGAYATVLQWLSILRGTCMTISIVVAPSMVVLHARDESERVIRLADRSMRMIGSLAAIPIGILCGLGGPLLRKWLGPEFERLGPLVWMILMPLTAQVTSMTLGSVILASNRLRVPALVNVACGIGNVLLGIFLVKVAGWGMYGIAASTAAMTIVRHGLFTPSYAAAVSGGSRALFLRNIGIAFAQAFLIAGLAWGAGRVLPTRTWLELGIAAGTAGVPALAFVYLVGLGAAQRQAITDLVKNTFRPRR